MTPNRFLCASLLAAALLQGATAQEVVWERLSLIEGVRNFSEAVVFLPGAERDTVFQAVGFLYRLNDDESGWEQACTVSCSPHEVLVTSQGSLIIASPAGATNLDRSTDGGRTWQQNFLDGAGALHQSALPALMGPTGHGPVFAGHGLDLYRSDDDGKPGSWSTVGRTGGEALTFADVPPSDSLPDGRLLAGLWNGITYSDDGGDSWTPAEDAYTGGGFLLVHSFAWVPEAEHAYGGVMLASVDDREFGRYASGAVWRSEDGGATWERLYRFSPPVYELADINTVHLLRTDNGILWAGLEHREGGADPYEGSISRSFDGGITWEPANNGYGQYGVNDMSVSRDGRVYVASEVGVWRTVEPVGVASERQPEAESLGLSVRPNPSRQRVELALSGADRQPVEVVVVDAQGREVARREMSASSSWRINVSGWAPGVYHARLAGDRQLEAVAFTVVR